MTNPLPEEDACLRSRRTFLKLSITTLAAAALGSRAAGQSSPAPDHAEIVQRFVSTFEKRDTALLKPFLHPNIVFRNYGQPEIVGREPLLALWHGVFEHFETIRFETVHQAVNGNVVIEEQIHHLRLPGKKPAPIMNMAVYELREGTISAWRDYSDSTYAHKLLTES